ncbi:tripartite tricarboxylate transporter TctB family protein [Prosthecomicrobium sp. N25]|uniref:tripartite tricarboxylate transporter TctB family protein n=1 Tax=Prosthecomicrobium sp. N25 TaxID=3129254 RepID=UPI003077BEF7
MSKRRLADAVFAGAVLITSLVFLRESWKLPASRFDPLGPGAFPIAICVLLALLSAAALVLAAAGRDLGAAETSLIVGVGTGEGEGRPRHGLGVFVALATAAYAALLGYAPVGFFWATAAYVFATGFAMSDRSLRSALLALAVAAGVAAVLTLGFGTLLGFPLP